MGQAEAEGAGGGRFQVVALVHDQVFVIGQNFAASGYVGQQQGVVDDQQVRGLSRLPGAEEGAGAAGTLQAGLGRAGVVLGGDVQPDIPLGWAGQVDLGAVAAAVLQRPNQHLGQDAHFVRSLRPVPAQVLEAARAEIVRAAFQHSGAQINAEGGAQVGNVLLDQLVLQVYGVG